MEKAECLKCGSKNQVEVKGLGLVGMVMNELIQGPHFRVHTVFCSDCGFLELSLENPKVAEKLAKRLAS